MADHAFRKNWGPWSGVALTLAVLAYLLMAPVRAHADGLVPSVSTTVVPAAPQAAVTAAVAQAAAVQAVAAHAAPSAPAPVAPPPPPPVVSVPRPPAVPLPSSSANATSGAQPQIVAVPAPDIPAATVIPVPNASAGTPASIGRKAVSGTRAPTGGATRFVPGRAAGQRAAHRAERKPPRPGRATRGAGVRWPAFGVPAERATVFSAAARYASTTRSHLRLDRPVHRDAPPAGRARKTTQSPPRTAVAAPPLQLPSLPSAPPPGGVGAAAGGGGGATGATAAALLALVGICLMRALLPGRLALGLAPWRSALLVSRLERPG
jgi:hypothetical protein